MSEVNESEPPVNKTFSFKWDDYQNQLSGDVRQLLEEDCMVDVTLSVDGERIHAHRIVLCACSTLFKVNINNFLRSKFTMHHFPIEINNSVE